MCPLPGVNGIHTMRWLILPRAVRESGVTVSGSLVLWTVFDGQLDDHIQAMTNGARSRLDEVYAHCEGYPIGGTADAVATYLNQHTPHRDWIACFDAIHGRTVGQVHRDHRLREALKQYLDQDWTGCSQSHVYLHAKAWLKQQSDFKWALRPSPMPTAQSLKPYWLIAAGAGLALLVAFPVTAPLVVASVLAFVVVVLGLWLFLLHWDETGAELSFVPPRRAWFNEHDDKIGIRENEDFGLNRLTILTDLHPGLIRALTMRAVLWIVNFRAARATDGKLQGIETIHFAQWRIVDGGRRLLFMSNYDGRADDYFREFSDNAAPGVNAIWSNTVGFPPTTLLIGGGSRDQPRFQQSARAYQIPTDVWYFGYEKRSFTARRINENTRIRRGIAGYLTPPEVKEWLELVYADAP